jgi:predicted phage terminase large subunit-like protein
MSTQALSFANALKRYMHNISNANHIEITKFWSAVLCNPTDQTMYNAVKNLKDIKIPGLTYDMISKNNDLIEDVIIEAKASGEPLTHEFRRMGIPVIPFTPSKGKDKHTRVNACAPIFESGSIWYPEGEHYAEEVIEECASFPHGEYDDYVDSTTQAVLRYRQGSFVETSSDYKDSLDRPTKEYKYY